ncbi:MAG: hypothetical protein FWD43_06185, partial [Coriobacteriia bacterium]|nr:hypothetical protein [Coriobacteriia bacterium]
MKKLIFFVMTVALMFAVSVPAFAAPAPVSGDPAWDVKYKKKEGVDQTCKLVSGPLGAIIDGVVLKENPRTDASGDKIPSNAHSADYPGLYFYWDDKQKDDGVLLVKEEVFSLFEDGKFILTAKDSNNYWGYLIAPWTAAKAIDGVFVYYIPKTWQYHDAKGKLQNVSLKNINMVFIDGKYKSAWFEIEKKWFDEDGNPIEGIDADDLNALLTFNNGYKLGENEVKITDYTTAYNGKKITVTEGAIPGYKPRVGSQNITVKITDETRQVVTFNNDKQWAYIKIVKEWDLIPGSEIPATGALFYVYNASGALVNVDEPIPAGTYQVKSGDGPFKVVELAISGFTADKESVEGITVEAGKTATVTFNNVEDR